MRSIELQPGIAVSGHNVNNIGYADDTILIATNQKEPEQMVGTVVMESGKKTWASD